MQIVILVTTQQYQSLEDNYNQQLPKLQISVQLASMIKETLKQITLKAIHIFNKMNSIQPTYNLVNKISYISQTMKIISIKDNKNNIFLIKGKINGTKLINQMIFYNQIFQTIFRPTKNSSTKKFRKKSNFTPPNRNTQMQYPMRTQGDQPGTKRDEISLP